ncbi:MAG TPA: outer membrane beta-barrel protein [Blastocatellia bacterium]|nr:outer membrane beta-barrel protein [Blastocatellia bacterium]
MRKVLLLFAVLFVISIPARAQSTYPSAEIFGGYSYFNQDLNIPRDRPGPFDIDERESLHGAGFSLAGNLSSSFGLVADFSYNKRTIDFPGGDIDISNFVFLFGPRFSARGSSVTGFGHVLVGGTRRKIENFDSETGLTIGIGAGVDVNVSDGFAIRLGQIDYLPTRFNVGFGDHEWFNNFRFQIGVVFKAGNH